MSLLSSFDDFGLMVSSHPSKKGATDDVASLPEQLEVLHDCSSAVLNSSQKGDIRFSGLYLAYKTDNSVNIPYLSALADGCRRRSYHVSPLESETTFHKTDDLVKVAISLVKR